LADKLSRPRTAMESGEEDRREGEWEWHLKEWFFATICVSRP